jgi:hypothetical protein
MLYVCMFIIFIVAGNVMCVISSQRTAMYVLLHYALVQ